MVLLKEKVVSRTQDQKNLYFIKRAELVHGFGTYDYSNSVYINNKTKLEIRCLKHDLIFYQAPDHHVNKKCRCPKCGRESGNSKQTKTTEDFIKDSKALHGDTYSYDKSIYINKYTNLIITCPTHGDFKQTPSAHLRAGGPCGCPNCYGSKGEIAIKKFLDSKNIKYTQQKTFNDCKHKGLLRFDFYLDDFNTVVEFHGIQHFEPIAYFGGEEGFKLTQERDKIKKDYCATNGITMLELTEPAELAIFKVLSKHG